MPESAPQLTRVLRGLAILLCGGMMIFGGSTEVKGQENGRSLRTWVDTLDIPLCEDKEFSTWGVWIESASMTDTVLGFRLEDSVLAVELTLRWDTSRVRLLPPYLLDPIGSLVGRFPSKVQGVDTTTGELFVSASSDLSLRPSVGTGIPLFYLKGRVRETDTAVGLPAGGARVQSLTLEGRLGAEVTTVRHLPGYVQVVRDTTPEYTGTLSIEAIDLDTNRRDTVRVSADNIDSQRVREISFSVVSDTGELFFAEVLPLESGHPWQDVPRVIQEGERRIDVHYGAEDGEELPPLGDLPLLQLIVERGTDSQFVTDLALLEPDINRTSCLGRLIATGGSVTGAKIMPVDTTGDTSKVSVPDDHDRSVAASRIRFQRGGYIHLAEEVTELLLYDLTGREVGVEMVPVNGARVLKVKKGYSGPVFAVIRLNDGRIERVKQYIKSE